MRMHVRLAAASTLVALGLALVAAPAAAQLGDAFPGHGEVTAALAASEPDAWVHLVHAGASLDGRALDYVVVTDPESDVPMQDRVVTMILTQQHGNEPAGTPAALRLLDEIGARGPAAELLRNQVLILWPMGNPDGAEADQRANSAGSDLNRDHVHLEQPETQALHAALNAWDVHVLMDHHEYGGVGLGEPVPVRFYDYDVTTLFPRHGNVRTPTQAAAESLMYDGIWPALAEAGYSVNEYGEQTAAGIPIDHTAGGPDPGILRNNVGLQNIAGLLVETFVGDLLGANPFIDAEHRIGAHRVVMQATLAYASQHATDLIAAKRDSERLNLDEPMTEYLELWPADPLPLPIDAVNEDRRGPLAAAYAVDASLDDVMARHGLPPGTVTDAGFVYSLHDVRAGLLAAMLSPDSSRHVADAQPVDVPAPATDLESEDAAFGLVLAAAALVAVALRRRGPRDDLR